MELRENQSVQKFYGILPDTSVLRGHFIGDFTVWDCSIHDGREQRCTYDLCCFIFRLVLRTSVDVYTDTIGQLRRGTEVQRLACFTHLLVYLRNAGDNWDLKRSGDGRLDL